MSDLFFDFDALNKLCADLEKQTGVSTLDAVASLSSEEIKDVIGNETVNETMSRLGDELEEQELDNIRNARAMGYTITTPHVNPIKFAKYRVALDNAKSQAEDIYRQSGSRDVAVNAFNDWYQANNRGGQSEATITFSFGTATFKTGGGVSKSWADKVGDFFSEKGKDVAVGVAVGAATGLLTGGVAGAAVGAAGGAVKGAVGGDMGNLLGGVVSGGVENAINSGDGMSVSDVLDKVNDSLGSVGTSVGDVAGNVISGAVTGLLTGGGSDGVIGGAVQGVANSFGVSGTVTGKNGSVTVDMGGVGSHAPGTGGVQAEGWRLSYNMATDRIIKSVPVLWGKKGV